MVESTKKKKNKNTTLTQKIQVFQPLGMVQTLDFSHLSSVRLGHVDFQSI